MKKIFLFIALIISVHSFSQTKGVLMDANGQPYVGTLPVINFDTIQTYSTSGRVYQKMKEWVGIVTPTSASGYTVDISSAGFTTILSIQVLAGSNTSSALTIPVASLKSFTTTSLVINTELPGAAIPLPTGVLTGILFPLMLKVTD